MAEKRRLVDKELRAGAVRIVLETGKPIAQVAWDQGIATDANLDPPQRPGGSSPITVFIAIARAAATEMRGQLLPEMRQ